MNKYNLIIFFALLFVSVLSYGQDQGRWTVEKNTKKIVLPEANRNFEKVKIEPPQLPVQPQEYVTTDIEIGLPKITTRINVIKMKEESIKKLYGNYVKAGFGNYTTPYLEGFFNNKRSENLLYGLHLKHFSSQNGPIANSGLSQNQADGYLKYFGKNYEFTSGLSYIRNRYNFYGYNHEIKASQDSLKHFLNTVNFNAGIKSTNSNDPLSYNLNFNYYNFSDNRKAHENEYLVTGGTAYKIDSEKSIQADMMLSVSSRKDSSTINRSFFQIKPALVITKDQYKVTGGFNIAYTNDTISNTKLHLYPRVNVDYYLLPSTLTLFAGINGEMQKNTLRSFTYQNPYLQSNVPLAHTNKAFEVYGGVKGSSNGWNYRVRADFSNYKYFYLFNNSLTDSSKFTTLYDKSTSVVNLGGALSYEVTETFRLGVNLDYYNYSTSSYNKAYHRPNFVGTLSGTYNLYKKIFFNADIYYISGLTGKNFISQKEVNLNSIIDANLKANYKFSNVFSAFLELNNILSQKYQRYLYYPVKGINVIGGIAYSF